MRTVADILRAATRQQIAEPVALQLSDASHRLTNAAPATGGFRGPSRTTGDLVELLREVRQQISDLAREAQDAETRRDLDDIVREMDRAIAMAEGRAPALAAGEEGHDDMDVANDLLDGRTRIYTGRIGHALDRASAYGWPGQHLDYWPFLENGVYRVAHSVRYNRVEGLVIGISHSPLTWTSRDRARIFGRVGYATALDDIRYEVGAETRLGERGDLIDVKIGGSYHQDTDTRDLWKSNWTENSLAAIFFKNDFFDYWETEGYQLYASARLTPLAQVSVAYRSDEYRTLAQNTTWSLFGGDDFQTNPAIVEGDMESVVVAVEGGRLHALKWRPRGLAFRAEAEFGEGLGGDFDFSRFVGDVRGYARLSSETGASIRLRGGTTSGSIPFQKAFSIGGNGSVRAYPQNAFVGDRMALLNAEVEFYDASIGSWDLDDTTLFGFFDAGWTNTFGTDELRMDDVLPAAGLGLALDNRKLRFELAWPLRGQIKKIAATFGVELRRNTSAYGPGAPNRPLAITELFYEDVRARGFQPRFILDVGANRGDWTEMMLGLFPGARYLLLEPQHEMAGALNSLTRRHPNVTWIECGAGPEEGELVLHVSDDLNGSSFVSGAVSEATASGAAGRRQRRVPVRRIDDVVAEAGGGDGEGALPDLVKLDIQGFELEALRGAERLFGHTELFILEASLFRFKPGTPLLHEVIAFMAERGYVVYDVADYIRRHHDGALGQLDLVFARERGMLRALSAW